MEVTGHNIANANNPDFKRQEAVMGARTPAPMTGEANVGPLGGGVDVTTIRRAQDSFIQNRLMDSQQNLGSWQAGKDALDQVDGILNEPGDKGLSHDLNQFWNAWQSVSVNPEDLTSRSSLAQAGSLVASSLNDLSSQISQIGSQQDQALQRNVDQVNSLAGQIASLNTQIQTVQATGNAPNDFLDQRDALLGKLSQLADIQVNGNGGAGDLISINGHMLVQGGQAETMKLGTNGSGQTAVLWSDDSSEAKITGGAIGGILTVQRDVLPGYKAALDEIAQGLISRINELHKSGYGLDKVSGRDFFTGTGANDIQVSAEIVGDPRKIAASADGSSGDGSVALALGKVKTEPILNGSPVGDAYDSLVAKIGADASHYSQQVENQTQVQRQLSLQQQSLTGVSLDEEMANMVRFQQAYAASARVLSATNEMIGTLIDRLGVG
jgi:flagellar hook-associated protein 1 FlgK